MATLEKIKTDYEAAKALENNPVAYMRLVGPLFEDTLELLFQKSAGREWSREDGNLFDLIGRLQVDENLKSAWHKMRKMRNNAIHEDNASNSDVQFFKKNYEDLLKIVQSDKKVRVSNVSSNSGNSQQHQNTSSNHKKSSSNLTDDLVKTAVNTGIRALINAIFRK